MGTAFEHKHDGDAAEVLNDEYVDAYLQIREEPPYNSNLNSSRERCLERTRRQVDTPGFHLVSARDDDGRLIGWAFGLPFAAGRWWGGESTPAPEEVLQAEKFAVIELNVVKEHRGNGYGRRLLEELVRCPEPSGLGPKQGQRYSGKEARGEEAENISARVSARAEQR
ncbi:GNAT family N-acetyltransferase [Sphaerisporangium sp. NBC_01403]|uniref:GNAT family N-acetyltransferase n=1 Tax=Sphaerisporangium sp. NBC_01403 TaxID=2903599 RepID=UPI003248AE87